MSEKPGIMLYFSDWTPMLSLDDASLAALIRATFAYASTGEAPDFDGISAVLWGIIAPKIDRDAARYDETCRQNRWKRYKGIEQDHDRVALSYEEWVDEIDTPRQLQSTAVNRCDQQQRQPQPQGKRQVERQPQAEGELQGDQRGTEGGKGQAYPVYTPPSEAEYERMRVASLARLEGRQETKKRNRALYDDGDEPF